jgi:hypothetical protein
MTSHEAQFDRLFEEMLKKGLVSTSSLWIERAIAGKSNRLALGIAHSRLLTYDRLDRRLHTSALFN